MADKNEMFKNVLAGFFFILGIFLIVMFVFTIGKDKGIADSKIHVDVIFTNIGGLDEGAPVRLSGVTIGSVGTINFLKEEMNGRRVRVTLNIFEKFKEQLTYATRITINTEGILGEKLVEIYTEGQLPAIDMAKPVMGEDPIDLQDLTTVFLDAGESFSKTAKELGEIDMVALAKVMQESSEALLVTAEGMNAIMEELDEIAKKSKRLMDRVEQKVIEGDLFKVF